MTMRRRLLAVPIALALAAVAGAGGAWAAHQFDDVPDGFFFHEAIGNIVAGGCATGFGDDTFRPADNASRGQFAFWMNNCGGRVAFDSETVQLNADTTTTNEQQPRVKIEAGAAGQGSGFVVVMTNWTARPPVAAAQPQGTSTGPDIRFAGNIPCPCNVETGVIATFSNSPANPFFAESADYREDEGSDGLRRMSGGAMQVVPLPAGADVELELFASYNVNETPT